MLVVFMFKNILSSHQEVVKLGKKNILIYLKKDIDTNILTKTLKCLLSVNGSNAISFAQQISLVKVSIAGFCVED